MCILTYGVILSDWFLLVTFSIFYLLFVIALGSAFFFGQSVDKLFLNFMFQNVTNPDQFDSRQQYAYRFMVLLLVDFTVLFGKIYSGL